MECYVLAKSEKMGLLESWEFKLEIEGGYERSLEYERGRKRGINYVSILGHFPNMTLMRDYSLMKR